MSKRRGPNGRCAICRHEERSRIEMLLACGVSQRAVSERFGVHHDSVWRHWRHHTPPHVRAAHAVKALKPGVELERLVAEESGALLEHLQNIRGKLYTLFDGSVEAGDRYGGSVLAAKLHENLGLVAKMTGELQKHVVPNVTNIFVTPFFADLQATLIRTLAPFPDARTAVIRAFRDFETRAALSPGAPLIEGHATVERDADRAA